MYSYTDLLQVWRMWTFCQRLREHWNFKNTINSSECPQGFWKEWNYFWLISDYHVASYSTHNDFHWNRDYVLLLKFYRLLSLIVLLEDCKRSQFYCTVALKTIWKLNFKLFGNLMTGFILKSYKWALFFWI